MASDDTDEYVGSGADEVRILLGNGDAFAWGDTIIGNITIEPRSYPVRIAEVTVAVLELDIDGVVIEPPFRMAGDTFLDAAPAVTAVPAGGVPATVVARDLALSSETGPLTIPFELQVPHGESLANAYSVAVRTAVASDDLAGDMEGSHPFFILPPRFLQGLIWGLDTFGAFTLANVRSQPREDGQGDQYDLDFAPPEELKKYLDGVRFLLEDDSDRVYGELEINPQEHTLLQHLESLVHADRVRFPLEFSKAELTAAAGDGKASEEAIRRLQELIGPYIR